MSNLDPGTVRGRSGRRTAVLARAAAACAIGLAATAVPSAAQEPAHAPFAIRDVRVFDGERTLEGVTVVVADGRIAAVGSDAAAPPDALVVDGRGRTLMPGLIDAHVHAVAPPFLRTAAVFGVTTVLDMFTSWQFAAALREEEAAGGARGRADVRSAGTAVTAPDGHATQFGLPIPTLEPGDDADAFVQARLDEGSDYIKVIYEDGSSFGIEYPSLDRDEVAAVIAAARRRGRMAVVHATTLETARDAIEAGADGLVHVFGDREPDARMLGAMRESRAFVTPTLSVIGAATGQPAGGELANDPELAPYLSFEEIAGLNRGFGPQRPGATQRFDVASAAVGALHGTGVPILAGTDAPNPGTMFGASMHGELALLVDAGLTPAEALAAATSAPARAFGLEDRGRIAPGLIADLVLVDGDPTTDIRHTRRIAAVWKNGHRLDRVAYREEVERARTAALERGRGGPPPGSEDGLVSDFEDGTTAARFGAGWMISTDDIMGGRSRAAMDVAAGGAAGGAHALRVTGEVVAGPPFAWAGVMFSPGTAPLEPANLADKSELRFHARGDGRTYRVMVFTAQGGTMPAMRTFIAGEEWAELAFPLSAFGTDGGDVAGVIFAAGPDPGEFELWLDEVRFR